MTDLEIKALRERTWHYLEPGVARCAKWTWASLNSSWPERSIRLPNN
jgi:hypothetical protein